MAENCSDDLFLLKKYLLDTYYIEPINSFFILLWGQCSIIYKLITKYVYEIIEI